MELRRQEVPTGRQDDRTYLQKLYNKICIIVYIFFWDFKVPTVYKGHSLLLVIFLILHTKTMYLPMLRT